MEGRVRAVRVLVRVEGLRVLVLVRVVCCGCGSGGVRVRVRVPVGGEWYFLWMQVLVRLGGL